MYVVTGVVGLDFLMFLHGAFRDLDLPAPVGLESRLPLSFTPIQFNTLIN